MHQLTLDRTIPPIPIHSLSIKIAIPTITKSHSFFSTLPSQGLHPPLPLSHLSTSEYEQINLVLKSEIEELHF